MSDDNLDYVVADFVNTSFGKNYVKLLQLRREGQVHHIKELEVNTALTLSTVKDYTIGDNSDIIATDSQKNTVYILAKQHGIASIEEFALLLSNHFLSKYSHVTDVNIHIEEAPWRRILKNGQEHVHAFILNPEVIRYCDVQQTKYGAAHVSAGLKDMKIMKTTQSAFVNFVDDKYRTLPDAEDRVFCTIVGASWSYDSIREIDFNRAWKLVLQSILDTFAGPPETGIFSPSVQHTLYIAEKTALVRVPQISQIEMVLPNVHYFGVDYSRFKEIKFTENKNEIFMPVDKPSGIIKARIERRQKAKL